VIDQPFDDQLLRDVFVDGSPRATIDYVSARQSVARRATRIRRRRTAGGAVAVAAVVVIGSSAWAATQRDPRSVDTQSSIVIEPTTIAKVTSIVITSPSAVTAATPSDPVEPATTVPEFIEVTEPVVDDQNGTEVGEAPVGGAPVTPASPNTRAPTTAPRRPTSPAPATSRPPVTSLPPAATTTSPPVQTTRPSDDHDEGASRTDGGSSGQQTYSSAGGSATLSWSGNKLTLVSTNPKSGWTVVQSRATSEKVSITFGKGTARASVVIELDNGRPKQRNGD
jgi:hypothetical protein